MPDEIEGASAVASPSRENQTPEPSFLDSMVDNMSTTESTRIQPGETPPVSTSDPVEEAPNATPPEAVEKPVSKTEVAEEPDELGISKLIPKKKPTPPPVAPSKPDAKQAKASAEEKITWQKAPDKLREAFYTAKSKADELESKVAALTKEKEEWSKKSAPPELEAKWKSEVENERKRAESAEENLRIVSYEKSPEFEREHIKPLEKAWTDSLQELVDQDIEVDGIPRKTTSDDVQTVVGIANTIQATRKARELFGPDAVQAVLEARTKIRGLIAKRDEAVSTWRTKGTEHQQSKARENEELEALGKSVYENRYNAYAKEYPEIWAPTDPKEKEAMDAVKPIVDVALFGRGVPKFDTTKQAYDFWGKAKADVAARVAALPVVLMRNATLAAQVEELQSKLKGYDTSEPTVGNKGEGEGRKAPRGKESGESGGLASMLAQIDAAPSLR